MALSKGRREQLEQAKKNAKIKAKQKQNKALIQQYNATHKNAPKQTISAKGGNRNTRQSTGTTRSTASKTRMNGSLGSSFGGSKTGGAKTTTDRRANAARKADTERRQSTTLRQGSNYLTGGSTRKATPYAAAQQVYTPLRSNDRRARVGRAADANRTINARNQMAATKTGTGKTWNEKEERQKAIDTLNANSMAWHNTSDAAEKTRLHAANDRIRKKFGMTYNGDTGATYLPKASGGKTNVSKPVVETARNAAFGQNYQTQEQRQSRYDELNNEIDRMQKQYPYLISMDMKNRNAGEKLAAVPWLISHPKLAAAGINGDDQYSKMSTTNKKQADAMYQLYKRLNDEADAISKQSAGKAWGSGVANAALNAAGAVENGARYATSAAENALSGALKLAGKQDAGQFWEDVAKNTVNTSFADSAMQKVNDWAQPVGSAKKAQELAGSGARMLPGMALGAATGTASKVSSLLDKSPLANASLAAIFGDSAASGAREALNDGASLNQALAYGAGSGLTEVGTEKMFGGIPGLNEGVAKLGSKSRILNKAFDVLGEGVEEAASTLVNPYLKRATYDKNAKNATAQELWDSAKGGMTLAGIMQGANAVSERLANRRYGTAPAETTTSIHDANADVRAAEQMDNRLHPNTPQALPTAQRLALPEGNTRTANTMYANENGGVANNLRAFSQSNTPDVLYGNIRGDFTSAPDSGSVLYASQNGQVSQTLPTGYLPVGRSGLTKVAAQVDETQTIPRFAVDDAGNSNGGLSDAEMQWAKLLAANQEKTGVSIQQVTHEIVDSTFEEYNQALQSAEQYVRDYTPQGTSVVWNADGTSFRASNNEKWYSDYYKKNGKAPSRAEAAQVAAQLVKADIQRGGGQFVSAELAQDLQTALEIQAAANALGENVLSAQIVDGNLVIQRGTPAHTENIQDTNARLDRNIISPVMQGATAAPINLRPMQSAGQTQSNPTLADVRQARNDIMPKLTRAGAETAQTDVQTAPPEITQPMQENAQGAAQQADINPKLTRAGETQMNGGTAETYPFGQNTVGAAQSAYAPEQKVSKVSSNTFANSTIFNDAEKQSAKIFDQDGDALYDVVTEKQSLDNARQRLDTDYDGEARDLPNKPNFSGEDNDTAMGILSRKLEEARQSGDYSEVNKWAKLIKEKGTEGGQLVQSFAKYSRTPEGVIVQGQREIDAAVKLLEKTNPKQLAKWQKKGYLQWTDADAQRSADYMQQAVDAGLDTQQGRTLEAKAMEVIADKMPVTAKNKIVSLLMDNMLGNFRTLITRNAGGNAMFSAPEAIRENFVAAPIDKLVSLKTKARTTYASPFAKSKAWAGGAKKGVSEMVSDIKSGVHTARSGENTSWQAQQKTFRDKGLGKLGNAYDGFVGSMLEAGDRPFYEAAFAAKMTDLEKARSQGKLTKDFQGKDFDTYAPQVARQAALEAVFQNNGTVAQAFSNIATGLGKLSKGTLGTASLQQSALPFTKTPGNLVERAIEYSPFGVLKNAVQTGHEKRTGTFNQQRFVTETSRNIVGSAIFALAGSLVASGMLRGALPDDKDEAEALKNAGEQAYSIRIGDKNYSYSWIPVIGPALAGAADFYQTMNDMDSDKAAAVWNAAEGYLNSAIFEQSSLSSLPDLFGGSYSTPIEGIGKTFASLPSQMVPSLVRQVATATDPYERQTYVKGNTIESQLNSIKASIPWLRQTLPVKVDEQGNEKLNSQGRGLGSRLAENMILPYKVTQQQSNDVRDELMRLKKATGETTQFQNKITYAVEHDGEKKNLTATESMQYQKIYGQESTKAIRELMASDTYKGLSDKEKVRAITEINSYAKTIADSKFVDIELSEAEQKVKNAVDKGIGIGDYMVFKNSVKSIEDKNTGADDSSKKNMQDIVDLFENGSFAKLTDEQKDYLYSSTGRSLATNPYHISEVEKSASDSSYYKNLSGEDKLIFRSYANEYEDVVNNGKSMDGWVAKAKLASDNGVLEPYQFAAYEQALMYADKDENGSLKQSEVAAAINTISGLSQTQKAYLWQSQNKSWKPNKNPFGSATVYWPEAKEKDNSVEAKVDKRIGGMQASQKTSSAGFVNPTTASNSVVTSGYGGRNAVKTSTGYSSTNHDGIDIGGTGGNLNGQAADSIGGGKVAEVGYDENGYGNYVVVDHGNGYTSLYGHLQKATVKQGDTVSAGQQVGVIGSTGSSTAPHLHLRVHKNGQSIDPRTVIPGYGG